jgi:AIR synthase related protein, N-terminal domain
VSCARLACTAVGWAESDHFALVRGGVVVSRQVTVPADDRPLLSGKIPLGLLARLLAELPGPPPGARLGAQIGEDACAIEIPSGLLVVSADPITLTSEDIGRLSVTVNANDVAVSGARPRWFLAVVLVPPATSGRVIRDLLADVGRSPLRPRRLPRGGPHGGDRGCEPADRGRPNARPGRDRHGCDQRRVRPRRCRSPGEGCSDRRRSFARPRAGRPATRVGPDLASAPESSASLSASASAPEAAEVRGRRRCTATRHPVGAGRSVGSRVVVRD